MRRAFAALMALASMPDGVDAQRPNVVLVMADDLGWGDLGVQGHPHLQTPHLDQMAADGARFTRFHAAAPVCSPTRASCLTGRHPYRCDIPHANRGHLREDELTLPSLLKDAGYRTGHFGKWHLGTLTTTLVESNRGGPRGRAHYAPPWERGFDACFSTEAKVPTFDPMKHPQTGAPYGTHYWTGPEQRVERDLDGDDSRLIVDRALPFLRRAVADEQPFFCVVWFHAPHLPCVASAADRARYREFDEPTQHYFGCITAMDREVGRLRAALDDLGVAEQTMIWFCSDNGPEGKAGKAPGSSGGLRGRKRSLYEGGTRVPGMLAWPGTVPAGLVVDTLACTSDYLPTIASWLDLPLDPNHRLDGVDLRPALAAAADGEALPRDAAVGFESARMASWTDDRFKLVARLRRGAEGAGALPPIDRVELYDLARDPREQRDVADEPRERAGAMRRARGAWRTAIRQRP